MIRLVLMFAASLILFGSVATADTRGLYTVSDIPVDERAETVIVAQQQAFSYARFVGVYQMIDRITLEEDRLAASEPIEITQELADWLTAAVDVQEEARGGNRYRGTLSVVYNPRNVRSLLNRLGIPYVDSQAPLALAVPIVGRGISVVGEPVELLDGTLTDDPRAIWSAAWGDGTEGALAHFVTSNYFYSSGTGWSEVQDEVVSEQAQRAFMAVLTGRPGSYRVTVETLTASGRLPVGTTAPQPDIDTAAAAALALLDEAWKRQVIVRSDETTLTEASITYTSLAEWNTLRGALNRSPLVSGFQIRGVSRDGAVVNFAYASDLRRLALDLRQRGVAMDVTENGLKLQSARNLALPADQETGDEALP